MRRPYPALLAMALLATAAAGYSWWQEDRFRDCEQRSAQLSSLDLLRTAPDGWQGGQVIGSCDVDRSVAYAASSVSEGRKAFAAADRYTDNFTVNRSGTVTHFYRRAAERDGWTVSPPAASYPVLLCARKSTADGSVHLRVSVAGRDRFDISVTEIAEPDGACP